MASKINLLIINCRDFNFPHAGNVDVKLLRVKHSIKIKVITYIAKKLSTRTDYYIAHTETYTWEHITNSGVEILYDNILTSLNYTDKFTAHYGYSDGDIAGAYNRDAEYFIDWFCDTLFSFNADKESFKFPVEPIADAMRGVSEAMTHGVDAMIMAGRTVGKSAHLFPPSFADVDLGVDKSVVTTVRGGREPLKELKVSPLAKSSLLDKVFGAGALFEGKIHLTPELLDEMKKFGR